jgi:hypothetical protein
MSRIDRIIRESIDRFILREANESKKYPSMDEFENPNWKKLGRKKKQQPQPIQPQPNPQPQPNIPNQQPQQQAPQPNGGRKRIKPKTLFDAVTVNQIGMVIRKSWVSMELRTICTMNRSLERIYGRDNAAILRNFFNSVTNLKPGDSEHDLFIIFTNTYNKLQEITKEIEEMAKEGATNERYVISKITEMPIELEGLANVLDEMHEKAKSLKILAKQQKIRDNSNPNLFAVTNDVKIEDGVYIKKAVINGYRTTAGINKLIIFDKGKVDDIREKLFALASNIRKKWGDNFGRGVHNRKVNR